jgi:hypothetical protein
MLKKAIRLFLAIGSVCLVASCDKGDDSDDSPPPVLFAPVVPPSPGVSTASGGVPTAPGVSTDRAAFSGVQTVAWGQVTLGPVDSDGNRPDSKGVVRSSGGSHRSAQMSPNEVPTASLAHLPPTVTKPGVRP